MDDAMKERFHFQYFPEHFMWSQGMTLAIEMARWGGSAMSEVDRVGRRLKGRIGDGQAWGTEWEKEARRVEKMGDDAAAEKHFLTAGAHYLRAATYYFVGERYAPQGRMKEELYAESLRCFAIGYKWRYPNIEQVKVPYQGTTLPALFMKARGVSGRAPTVCFFDGFDMAKEFSVLFGGVELANRGIHTLAIDGPGQGEALRLQNIPSRYDYDVPAAAAYDYVASRSDVDPQRIAIMAFSLGGYYAPRAAAFEKRFAACVAWGAHWDYHATWAERRKHLEAGGNKTPAPYYQLKWVMGESDMDAAMKKLERYKLEGVAEKITCPTLIMHGERDTLVPVEAARKLYDAVGAKVKRLKIFTAEDGGAEHCQTDNRLLGANYIADWLADTLKATPPQL